VIDFLLDKILEPLTKAAEFFFKWADITGFLERRGLSSVWATVVGILGGLFIVFLTAIIWSIIKRILKKY